MKKVLLAMLVLTAIIFAENVNSNGDVQLVAVDDAREVLKAAVTAECANFLNIPEGLMMPEKC
jgi:hypothetical protein